MIRYIFGRAGTGKTHLVFEEIKKRLESTEHKKLILIVPEQFTLQAERDLIEKLDLPGMIDVEVLSFTRLAYNVLMKWVELQEFILMNKVKIWS